MYCLAVSVSKDTGKDTVLAVIGALLCVHTHVMLTTPVVLLYEQVPDDDA